MAPINTNNPQPLEGLPLRLAQMPLSDTVRGGVNNGQNGIENTKVKPASKAPVDGDEETTEPEAQFPGLGPWLEDDETDLFKTINDLVLRQEILAKNRWEQDKYWTYVKLGYPWATLEKVQNQDIYKCSLPYGTSAISIQGIPNKAWDLCNKAAETLLLDFPQPDCQQINDTDEAEQAADFADRFLSIDGGEIGTSDTSCFYQALDKALICASSFLHVYNDPTGNGWVPLQLLAHPHALSPDQPELGPPTMGPDGVEIPGAPTTDPILRYVTPDNQFTDDPNQADRQWLSKLCVDVLGREHVRTYPESLPAHLAEKVLKLYYCTVGQAKRRWRSVAEMEEGEISALCDWTPPYYLRLLPPSLRARWRFKQGESQKAGDGDERILFYYEGYVMVCPEHPEGAHVVLSGAQSGTILERETWMVDVEMPKGNGLPTVSEKRKLDCPMIQLTPRQDPDERDATGRCYIEMFGGANEFKSYLFQAYENILDLNLHPERYIPSTSPVQGFQIANSRATGTPIPILRPQDTPIWGPQIPIPVGIMDVMTYADAAEDSIASLNKPLQGSDSSQEVSGIARQVAVQQSRIGLNRMGRATNDSASRFWRVKLQGCQKYYTVPQQLRYTGDDGSSEQREFTGTNFALVGDVTVKQGTGTQMTPEGKVGYLADLVKLQLIGLEEAAEASRSSYTQALGLSDNPHEQYIERCVTLWMQGPPEDWEEQDGVYQQQMAQYQAAVEPVMQQANMQAQQSQLDGDAPAPPPQLPPEPQQPWNPFRPRPNDGEPEIAILWKRKLSKIISSTKFDAQPPGWQRVLAERYAQAAQASAPQPMMVGPDGQPVEPQGQPGQPQQQQSSPQHPTQLGAAA